METGTVRFNAIAVFLLSLLSVFNKTDKEEHCNCITSHRTLPAVALSILLISPPLPPLLFETGQNHPQNSDVESHPC